MKKIMIGLIVISLMTLVFAGGVALNYVFQIEDVTTFNKTPTTVNQAHNIEVTLSNGTKLQIQETDGGEWDNQDIQTIIDRINGTVTSVELIGVGKWQENKYGERGFDAEKLKAKECSHEGFDFDSKTSKCIDKVIEEIDLN